MTITLTKEAPLDLPDDDLKQAATLGRADRYEFGPITRRGRQVKLICRQLKTPSPQP